MTKPPFNSLNVAPALVDVQARHDRAMILRSPQKLGPYRRSLRDYLLHWGTTTPDNLFLVERLHGCDPRPDVVIFRAGKAV